MPKVVSYSFSSNTVLSISTNVKVITLQKSVKLGRQTRNYGVFNAILQISSFVHAVGDVAISEELDRREEMFEAWWEYGVGR